MNKFFLSILTSAALLGTLISTTDSPAMARKTGGAPQRLQEKQLERHRGAAQNQPRLAHKAGGSKTRLLHQQRAFYRSRTA